jgi:sodium-dependent phosphate cotransporter
VIAALGLSLFAVGVVSAPQLFLMIAGSRLGAVATAVFVGALDHVQTERYSLRKSVGMGLLTFLCTLSIYLPVTVLGSVLLPYLRDPFRAVSRGGTVGVQPLALFTPSPSRSRIASTRYCRSSSRPGCCSGV